MYGGKKMKIYPNAKLKEIKANATFVPYGPRGPHYEYRKGNFLYLYSKEEKTLFALYTPSYNKKIVKMFDWNFKTKRWKAINYKKGTR